MSCAPNTPDPQSLEPLPTSPERLLAYLAELGIAAVTHSHPPLHTVEESKALRGELPGGHCKSLFLKDRKGRLWLLVADEDRRVELNRLHTRLGSARLSFASTELLWEVLGVRPGSVTPFALVNDRAGRVSVALDRHMLEHELVNYHPLLNDKTTAIRPADLLSFIRATGHEPAVVDLMDDEGAAGDPACGGAALRPSNV
ncbi:MAG TPA: prolyl-tRNA synthetase associated domain-containing protein [Azospirillaceae bacterium]|nr:prolyl-tRNA synthetase associated domain-containing protein [Azospirillaceae bacterium]